MVEREREMKIPYEQWIYRVIMSRTRQNVHEKSGFKRSKRTEKGKINTMTCTKKLFWAVKKSMNKGNISSIICTKNVSLLINVAITLDVQRSPQKRYPNIRKWPNWYFFHVNWPQNTEAGLKKEVPKIWNRFQKSWNWPQ